MHNRDKKKKKNFNILLSKEILAFKVTFSAELPKLVLSKVAEVAKGLRRNVGPWTKILSFFCRHIRICGYFHTLAKKGFCWGAKNSISCARSALLHGLY